jgi:hypothetical protein
MLRFKPAVRIRLLTPQLVEMLAAAAIWSEQTRVDVEVNSINDGDTIHQHDSLHGYDLAADLDTVGDKATDLQLLWRYLRRVMPPQYDVVYERDHVHVEWDARRGPAPTLP